MARRLTTVIYDLSPEPEAETTYGDVTIDAGADRELLFTPVKIHAGVVRRFRYRMLPTTTSDYSTSTPGIVTQAARGGWLVRDWIALEPMYSAPTGTTVQLRLHDGAGTEYYWTGAAWATAGASDWNTPVEVRDNFTSLDPSVLPSVGLEWRLSTTDKTVTPYAYGGTAAAGLWFGVRSGTTAAGTLSDGWADDLIHRVTIPWLRALEPERTDESVADGALPIIDYSDGPGGGSKQIVRTATVAYDLTADAACEVPLSTSWNAGTKVLTFTPAVTDGHRYAVRLIVEPSVVFGGDRDLFLSEVPQIVIESVGEIKDGPGGAGYEIVRDTTAETVLRVPSGRPRTYPMTLLIQSDGYVSALELIACLERALDGRTGVVLVSGGTGMPIQLRLGRRARPARTGFGMQAAARIDLIADTVEYYGASQSGTLIADGGVIPTVRTPRAS